MLKKTTHKIYINKCTMCAVLSRNKITSDDLTWRLNKYMNQSIGLLLYGRLVGWLDFMAYQPLWVI